MSFRRKTRGSSRKSARKSYWAGAAFYGQDVELFSGPDTNDIASAWVKYPSGQVDSVSTAGGVSPVQPRMIASDETLVRTIVSSNVTLRLQGLLQAHMSVDVVMGLIAWDSNDPTELDGVVGLEAPSPIANPQADWIIRLPFVYTVDNFSLAAQASEFITSRAMRKLPPNTGLLACIALENIFDQENTFFIDWSFDFRFLLKSGYMQ